MKKIVATKRNFHRRRRNCSYPCPTWSQRTFLEIIRRRHRSRARYVAGAESLRPLTAKIAKFTWVGLVDNYKWIVFCGVLLFQFLCWLFLRYQTKNLLKWTNDFFSFSSLHKDKRCRKRCSLSCHGHYCFVPRCLVTFWTHPEIIPVGQFLRRWIQSINQSINQSIKNDNKSVPCMALVAHGSRLNWQAVNETTLELFTSEGYGCNCAKWE